MTFSALCDHVSSLYSNPTMSVFRPDAWITSVCAADELPQSPAGALLVCTADQLSALTLPAGLAGVTCIGSVGDLLPANINFVSLRSDLSLTEVTENIRLFFQRSISVDLLWNRILELIAVKGSIHRIIDFAGELFGNPVVLADSSTKLIARSAGDVQGSVLWNDHSKYKFFTSETMQSLDYVRMKEHLKDSRTPILLKREISQYETLNGQVWVDSTLIGTVSVLNSNQPFRDTDSATMLRLCQALGYYFRKDHFYRFVRDAKRESFYQSLLEDRVALSRLLSRARSLGIDPDLYYCLAVIGRPDWEQNDHIFDAQASAISQCRNELEWFLPRCTCLVYNGFIVAVLSWKLPEKDWYASRDLLLFLERNGLTMGVSSTYFSPSRICLQYRQAAMACHTSSLRDSGSPVRCFDDHALYYLFRSISDKVPLEDHCSASLKALISYDEENGTDYLQTLRAFLQNNGRITETAKSMFVHRSSLIYRLKKTEAIAQIDLSRSDDRRAMFLSMILLDL